MMDRRRVGSIRESRKLVTVNEGWPRARARQATRAAGDCRRGIGYDRRLISGEVLDRMGDESVLERVRGEVVALCRRFPVDA